jgi:hypothetical protein
MGGRHHYASQNEIAFHEIGIGDVDLEIGLAVAVHIARKDIVLEAEEAG